MRSAPTPTALRLAAGLCAALAATTACGASDASDEEDGRDKPVEVDLSDFEKGPIPDSATALKEEMPDDGLPLGAPFHEEMAWEALERATNIGGRVDPDADADCPSFEAEKGASATCQVSYLGHDLDARIKVTEVREYSTNYTIDLSPQVITRDKALEHLRGTRLVEWATCDMGDVAVIEPGNPEKQVHCRGWGGEHDLLYEVTVEPTWNGLYEFPGDADKATPLATSPSDA